MYSFFYKKNFIRTKKGLDFGKKFKDKLRIKPGLLSHTTQKSV